MDTIDRRNFLKGGIAAAIAAGPMQGLMVRSALAKPGNGAAKGAKAAKTAAKAGKAGYGPLMPTASSNTGETLMWLPRGFSYEVFGKAGSPMNDGVPTPANHDGMASFHVGGGRIRMIRNQELFPSDDPNQSAFGTSARTPYDPQAPGGTTTIELSPSGKVIGSWTSLNGTTMNCAGGAMPWGSWISCEENISGPDANTNFRGQTLDLTRPHGYIFEVPVSRGPNSTDVSEPLTSAGRFNHEAVAWGHDDHLYLTEDNFDGPSGFYRYRPPNDPMADRRLANGGVLEVMVVEADGRVPTLSSGSADMRGKVGEGASFRTRWVTIDEPNPVPGEYPGLPANPTNTEMSRAVALQGFEKGAANFARIEGCWYGEGKIFFNATAGGAPAATGRSDSEFRRGTGVGQVWMYEVATGILTLLVEPDPVSENGVLDSPDNITISPRGSLLICEDGDGANFLRGVLLDGTVFDFARTADGIESEWAGGNFNPNGNVLFANLQDVSTPDMPAGQTGLSVAIKGPFPRGGL